MYKRYLDPITGQIFIQDVRTGRVTATGQYMTQRMVQGFTANAPGVSIANPPVNGSPLGTPVTVAPAASGCGCACGSGNKAAACCGTGNLNSSETYRFNRSTQNVGSGAADSSHLTKKQGYIKLCVRNTSTTDAKDVILFDADGGGQAHYGVSAIPAGVTVEGIGKDYQVFINQISSRIDLGLCSVKAVIKKGDVIQMENIMEFHAVPYDANTPELKGRIDLTEGQDQGNQRNLNYSEICVSQLVDPATFLKFTLNPETEVILTFRYSEISGGSR